MNKHTSLEKIYLSHITWKGWEKVVKGLCVRGELETEQTATYWPQVPLTIATLLSHSAGLLNQGSWGPKPSAGSWFSLTRTATQTVCGNQVILLFDAHLLPVVIAIAPNSTHLRSRLYLDIFDRMHLFLDWRRSICYSSKPNTK